MPEESLNRVKVPHGRNEVGAAIARVLSKQSQIRQAYEQLPGAPNLSGFEGVPGLEVAGFVLFAAVRGGIDPAALNLNTSIKPISELTTHDGTRHRVMIGRDNDPPVYFWSKPETRDPLSQGI